MYSLVAISIMLNMNDIAMYVFQHHYWKHIAKQMLCTLEV